METVKRLACPQGHAVFQHYEFCSKCGRKLVEVDVPGCSKCDYAWIGKEKYCPHCGNKRR